MSPFDGVSDYDDIASLKTPPYSLEAEQAVLGGLLIDPGAWDRLDGIVAAEDFYRPEHRRIFEVMASLGQDGSPIDPITVADALSHAGQLEQAGGFGYIAELAAKTPGAANVRAYAQAVRERAQLRSLIMAGTEIADSGYNADGRAVADLIDAAQQRVMALGAQSQDGGDLHCSSRFASLIAEWERRSECDGLVGLSTGFEALDRRTNGLGDGNLVILAARPSMGKTALAMNIAEHVAVVEKKPVLVFSMEMSTEELLDRVAASLGRIPYEMIRTGKVFEHSEYSVKVMPTVARLKAAPLYIDDRSSLTVQQMRTTARKIHAKTPVRLVIVDYLQLAGVAARGRNNDTREQEVSGIARGLKSLAKELGCPVIALSQLNRNVEQRPNKRPVNSDLRDSGAIEQDADVIMFIYRDEVYNEDSPEKGITEIITRKLRNGQPGTDRIASNLAMCRFDNLAHDYQPPAAETVRPSRRGGFEY